MLFTVVCIVQYVLNTQWSIVNWLFPLIPGSSGIIGCGEESAFIKKEVWGWGGFIARLLHDSPRCWDEDGAEVTHGHGEQDTVGGGPHAGPAQDYDDDGVGDQGDHGQHRHDDPQQREHKHHRAVRGRGVKCVASPVLETPGNTYISFLFMAVSFQCTSFRVEREYLCFLTFECHLKSFQMRSLSL